MVKEDDTSIYGGEGFSERDDFDDELLPEGDEDDSKNKLSLWIKLITHQNMIHAITYIVIVVLIAHEIRFGAIEHPLTLRVYWIVNFVVICLFSASAILRLSTLKESSDYEAREYKSLQQFRLLLKVQHSYGRGLRHCIWLQQYTKNIANSFQKAKLFIADGVRPQNTMHGFETGFTGIRCRLAVRRAPLQLEQINTFRV